MANLRNEFEFRSALLTALGQEHTEAEAKNEDTWRRKMLDGLGVEYDQNDVNQFGLFREKLIEGVTKKSEGGGGSSDFSTAEVTSSNDSEENLTVMVIGEIGPSMESVIESSIGAGRTASAVLYKGHQYVALGSKTVTINSGSAEIITIPDPMFGDMNFLDITGDCTITIS